MAIWVPILNAIGYLAVMFAGTVVGSAIITKPSPLELLQVKE